jgi:hypothetical protein
VLARIETNIPSSSPDSASRTWRWDMEPSAEAVRAGAFGGLVRDSVVLRDMVLLREIVD